MKKFLFAVTLAALLSPLMPATSQAATPKAYYGRLLVETADSKEAWYVNPVDGKTSYFSDPANALIVMPLLALGISDKNLLLIARTEDTAGSFDLALSKRLAGRFLLQVESRGQLWYVNPTTYKRHFVGNQSDVLALYGATAGKITATALKTFTYTKAYNDAAALLKQAHTLMAGEKAPFKNLGEQTIADGKILRRANANMVVYTFTLGSALPADNLGYPYGPITAGKYHLASSTKFYNDADFVASEDYDRLIGRDKSKEVVQSVMQLANLLEYYYADIGAYPVSSSLVYLPTETDIFFSKENGFFGTKADKTVYGQVRLPKVKNSDYLYISFDGQDYSLSFTLEKDYGGFRAGKYIVSSHGVQDAAL